MGVMCLQGRFAWRASDFSTFMIQFSLDRVTFGIGGHRQPPPHHHGRLSVVDGRVLFYFGQSGIIVAIC